MLSVFSHLHSAQTHRSADLRNENNKRQQTDWHATIPSLLRFLLFSSSHRQYPSIHSFFIGSLEHTELRFNRAEDVFAEYLLAPNPLTWKGDQRTTAPLGKKSDINSNHRCTSYRPLWNPPWGDLSIDKALFHSSSPHITIIINMNTAAWLFDWWVKWKKCEVDCLLSLYREMSLGTGTRFLGGTYWMISRIKLLAEFWMPPGNLNQRRRKATGGLPVGRADILWIIYPLRMLRKIPCCLSFCSPLIINFEISLVWGQLKKCMIIIFAIKFIRII